VVIGVAKVPIPTETKLFLHPPSTKTAEFEVKNRRAQKRGRGKSITIAVCYFYLFFEVINSIRVLLSSANHSEAQHANAMPVIFYLGFRCWQMWEIYLVLC